ncbi:MAG: PDZ domain-containing protein [Bacteriovoracaceae bacterium]|jgi:predicted metalloprotease with PDZ domain|nr:PDZ domain-containing protein [Bacteriovoracaceae bacterium]
MKIRYSIEIPNPKDHLLLVKIDYKKPSDANTLTFYLPSWSPGSYLMREYSRNIRYLKVIAANGEPLYYEQIDKGAFRIDWSCSQLNKEVEGFTVEYAIYCHELTVRTSHIDESHAFIHGPSVFMNIDEVTLTDIELEIKLNPLWSKIHTALKEISKQRSEFIYHATNYDDFIDSPIEIGCHESDGFKAFGKDHHLCFYGKQYPHKNDLKADIKKIVETVGSHFNRIPYENYLFITHFVRGLYGGLEHKNSTALHFDGRKLASRKDYINWLCLVCHEYFHTWNVKRIRPIELGPFDYRNENYTKLHWLTEGLTSFMDELLVLRSGLISMQEYLEMQKDNLKRYFSIPGKKFHSLEDSSFNAWIKLYRPDENSNNSSISYYLKGGLVFSTLHFDLMEVGKNINHLINALWERYEQNKEVGVTKEDVLLMIEKISSKEIADRFNEKLSTTIDIDFESLYKKWGMEFEYDDSGDLSYGIDFRYENRRVFISKVLMDGAAFKSGLNAADEILAINGQRFLKEDVSIFVKSASDTQNYTFTVSRLGNIIEVPFQFEKKPKELKSIRVVDKNLAEKLFL